LSQDKPTGRRAATTAAVTVIFRLAGKAPQCGAAVADYDPDQKFDLSGRAMRVAGGRRGRCYLQWIVEPDNKRTWPCHFLNADQESGETR
jgi:hypothetical protein